MKNAPTLPGPAPFTVVEQQIADSMPHDVVRLMTGALLLGVPTENAFLRVPLVAAHRFLSASVPDVEGALHVIRHGLLLAINDEGIVCAPETVVLQAAFWMLSGEVQAAELMSRAAASQRGRHA